MANIRPCPFCAADDCEVDLDIPGVMCTKCGATGPTVSNESVESAETDDQIEAVGIRLWNARVQS